MSDNPQNTTLAEDRGGLLAAITAYTIWGLFPVYFMLTLSVPALELLGHRVLWSVPFCFIILAFRKQLPDVITVLKNPKLMALLALGAIAVASNWGVYIWAVQHGEIFQGSLGYYMMPLLYVLVGVVFLKETLSPLQSLAITLAAIGVLILTVYGGMFPAISLFLAVTFTIYGVVKRSAAVKAMTGLFIETVILFVPAFAMMAYFASQGEMQFMHQGLRIDALIMFAGPLTVLPLVAFAYGARRIKLSTMGILQFVGPTLQFFCGLYFGEDLTRAHILCFIFIWVGVIVFCWDAVRKSRATQLKSRAAQLKTAPRS